MTKLTPYPKYKDSGVAWIGEVPVEWEINRIYSLFSETSFRGGNKDALLTVTQTQGILPQDTYQKISGRRLSQQSSEDYSNYKIVQIGDFIYNKMRMWQGAIGVTQFDGCVSPAYVTMRSKKEIISIYWENLFKTPNFLIEINRYSQGICDDQNSCTFDKFREITIAIPSVHEQQTIATFLDRETAKIDTLIAKKNRSIELLQEKRQALITHVVTKGLNPHAKMKDSGVEWIGETPEGWRIVPYKRLLDICNGQDYKHIEDVNGKYPIIGSGGEFAKASTYLYNGEAVLLGRKGTIDKPLYIKGAFWTIDTMFYSTVKINAHGKFCYYTALAIPFSFYSTNTALPSMTQESLRNHLVTFPEFDEQQTIAAYLDKKCAKIDTLIAKTQQSIALLKEKRQALITAAVTGKIDVREAIC